MFQKEFLRNLKHLGGPRTSCPGTTKLGDEELSEHVANALSYAFSNAGAGSSRLEELGCRLRNPLQEGVVDVALIPLSVEQVAIVLVQRFVLAPPPWQVRVGQEVTAQAHQVCVIGLYGLYGTLPVVAACR